jgi:hypothetical protein
MEFFPSGISRDQVIAADLSDALDVHFWAYLL